MTKRVTGPMPSGEHGRSCDRDARATLTVTEGHGDTGPGRQVLIRAGIPGKPSLKVPTGKPYPGTSTDVAKLLAEHGLQVTYEDEKSQRSYVSLNAAEFWIPILEVASSVLAGISGNFFSDIIRELIGTEKPESTILHIDYTVVPRRGPKRKFRASGNAEDVLKAMDQFERDVRDK